MVPSLFIRKRDGAAQNVRRKMYVRIRKNDPVAARNIEAFDQRVRFSEPARGQFRDINHFQMFVRARGFMKNVRSLDPLERMQLTA